MLRKILCPTDFSPGSEHALRVAARLAVHHAAELVVAHSWYLPPLALSVELPVAPGMIDDLIADAEQALATAVEQARALGVPRVRGMFLTGLAWERLCAAATDDADIDLIVMGTHGRTGIRRILLGSVTEKVIRHAPCSVLAVRDGRDAPAGFQHILCPVDFSASSRLAAELAAKLVVPTGRVTLLHAIEVPVRIAGELPADYIATVDRRAATLLEELAGELRATTTVHIDTRARIGSPGAQALHVLESEPSFDLAVVGSHGRTGLGRFLLGSVAEKVVRHAPCPVLVARART